MIHQSEIMIGNFIHWNPHFANADFNPLVQVEVAAILPDKIGYIRANVEHRVEPFEDDVITGKIHYAAFEDFEPIPVDDWLKSLNKKIKYPNWIRFVHELQPGTTGKIIKQR